jgi:membrane fusion protein (multidrug efflux system)
MTNSDNTPPPRSFLGRVTRWLTRTTLLIAVPMGLALGGLWFYMNSGRYVTTENAYVKAELIIVTAEVSGRVTEVTVADNQPVEAGDVLFRIDPARFEIEAARHEAELGAARQRVSALKARLRGKQAALAAAEVDAEFQQAELERSERLRRNGTISQFRLLEVQREVRRATSAVDVTREEISEVLAELGGDPNLPVERHPDVLRAQAELSNAKLDLDSATVRAPRGAVAANLRLQPGEYVEEGDPVISLIANDGYWVEANLKETDLTHLRVGQIADLQIDAYPDVVWDGEVTSLSPATGAEYALLPPQNASGNWVKVVQRIPVRLAIRPGPDAPPLRSGMSVAVSIDTGYERPLPEVLNTARAWIGTGSE